MAEEARLESVYTSKAYPGFESRSLRKKRANVARLSAKCERRSHFLCKNPLTFNELADFLVSKTENCSQLYVETKRSRFCVSVRIFLFAFLVLATNNKEGVHFKTNTLFVLFKVGYGYYSAKGFSVG